MTLNIDLGAALLMGLAGSGHCLAMCGGLAGAMGMQKKTSLLFFYNFGRILSYSFAGLIVASALFAVHSAQPHSLVYFRIFAGVMMILLALYLLEIRGSLLWLEKVGSKLWRHLQPLAAKLRGKSGKRHALLAGMLWGWLPCGLVYSALSWAAFSAEPTQGALFMFAFGVGTLPSMLLVGVASQRLQTVLKSRGFRWISAIILAGYGIATIAIGVMQMH